MRARAVKNHSYIFFVLIAVVAVGLVSLPDRVVSPVAAQQPTSITPDVVPPIAPGSAYRQTNFISDIPGLAPLQDPLLVNPWG